MTLNRRATPRYEFVADAEITEISSDTSLSAKTSDVGLGGCFLYVLTPFQDGAEVRIKISANGVTFSAVGNVVFGLPNMGMGIAFGSVPDDQLAILRQWTSGLKPMA